MSYHCFGNGISGARSRKPGNGHDQTKRYLRRAAFDDGLIFVDGYSSVNQCEKDYSPYLIGSMYGHTYIYSKSMDQPGKVANPARGQLDRET